MPFSLYNTPNTFHLAMDIFFKDINGDFVIPYLDDIIIFTKTAEEHKEHLDEVLTRLSQKRLYWNRQMQNILYGN